jgi:hypothetical protein
MLEGIDVAKLLEHTVDFATFREIGRARDDAYVDGARGQRSSEGHGGGGGGGDGVAETKTAPRVVRDWQPLRVGHKFTNRQVHKAHMMRVT